MGGAVKGPRKGEWRPIFPTTLWLFPVEPEGASTAAARQAAGRRGIALLIAIMIISVMMLFTSDLILSSQVNLTLATQTRDNLKAEYMAKSGLNAATLLLASDLAYVLFQAQQDPKASLVTGLNGIWPIMNGMPIGGETLDMMSSFQKEMGLNSVMDEDVLEQLKLFDGQFVLTVSDETQKINVNDCYNSRCSEVVLMLEALFACPAEARFLETKKVTGKELALRIKDYIDKDSRAEDGSGFNDENEPYLKRLPKQMAKNAPLDSVDELRMVEGWDEEIHAVFAPFITAFPFQNGSTDRTFQMNINTASRALLQCLFPEAKGDCNEKSTFALQKRETDQVALGSPGEKVSDILKETLCYTGGDGNPGEANNRANWFQQYSMVFRVQVEGTVGDSVRRLDAVVQRVMPDTKKNEKSTSRLLYWKVR
jgi:type II secretory pathway component PulK